MSDILMWGIIAILFLLGLAGIIIPGMPGIGLVFLGILIYGFVDGFTNISVVTVVIFGLISALALASDYAGSVVGSRIGGGRKWALIGTIVGTLMGAVTGGPIGIFVGAFIGALTGAIFEGNSHEKAFKVASLSVIGILGATVVQLLLAFVLIISFLFAVFI